MSITLEDVIRALNCCDFATESELKKLTQPPHVTCCSIKPFLLSTKLAVLKRDSDGRAYVIFRGTESCGLGTWILTNFQAASTDFSVVDSSMNHVTTEPELLIQAASVKTISPGVVHQGILRAWSQLWYGTDILNTTFLHPSSGVQLLFRYLALGMAVGLVANFFFCSMLLDAMSGLVAVLGLMAIESGSAERLFWRPSKPVGIPIFTQLKSLEANEQVWFVGHSLGGAMATLAFHAYGNWCAAARKDNNARLVTFGSPQVGDSRFVKEIQARYPGQFLHVIDKGDPVPYAPPPTPTQLLRLGPSVVSLSGIAIFIASVAWSSLYTLLWARQRAYGPWTDATGVWRLGATYNWITLLRHTRESYRERITAFSQQHFRKHE
jgi:Lipase (class 3)